MRQGLIAAENRFDSGEIQRNVARGYWRTDVVTDTLFERAANTPDQLAIVDRAGTLTYAGLAEQVRAAAASLAGLGVRRGDRVTIQMPNWREGLVAHYALERIGAVAIPMPPIYRAKEVAFILQTTEAPLAIVATRSRGFDFLAMYHELWPSAPHLATIVTVAGEPAAGEPPTAPPGRQIIPFDRLLHPAPSDAAPSFQPDPNVLMEIAFTSGSTGDPKGVMHTSNTLLAQDVALIRGTRLTGDDVMFIPSTIGHQLGYSCAVRMPVLLGVPIVFLDNWNPTEAIELMARHKVTYVLSTPTFLTDVLDSPTLARHDGLPSLRSWVLAGAVVPTALIDQAKARLPLLRLGYCFGITEMGALISNPPGGRPDKGSAAGLPDESAEIRVLGPEGEELPPGGEGELAMRTPSLLIGYYKRPDLFEAALTPDGFFLTGDQVRIDEDGYIFVTGRIKDLIKRGGENISPVEIEEILARHPAVADVAVVGLPDERLGERICAVVVPRPGTQPTLKEIADWVVSAGAAKQKCPERLELVAELPRTSVGKVHKAHLRKMLA
jgi:cyclohexanecarboxylate-CoA ligase